MRDTKHFLRHLRVETSATGGGQAPYSHSIPVQDPFHQTVFVCRWSLREWLKLLFDRRMYFSVCVRADNVAVQRWVQGADLCERCKQSRIDGPGAHETDPGYHHGDERLCQKCYYDEPAEPDKTVSAAAP